MSKTTLSLSRKTQRLNLTNQKSAKASNWKIKALLTLNEQTKLLITMFLLCIVLCSNQQPWALRPQILLRKIKSLPY